MQCSVKASKLAGHLEIPSSKSHTMRAILFASLAYGESIIRDYLSSPDTTAMINACLAFGAEMEVLPRTLKIKGVGGKPQFQNFEIDAGNSGQVFRFIAAIACLDSSPVQIDGDNSIRNLRPITPLLNALSQLGAKVSQAPMQQAPIYLQGPLYAGTVVLDGKDSQLVSALLMACAFLNGPTDIIVNHPGETPWIDLTLDWLKRLNIGFDCIHYSNYRIHGKATIKGFDYQVPGDFSSLAFPMLAGVITQSRLTFSNIDINDVQGDKKIIRLLQNMGIKITLYPDKRMLELIPSISFSGFDYDMEQMIDALPILAVLACFASSSSRLYNAAIARAKESDRLATITKGLRLMGAKIDEEQDALVIHPSQLLGAVVDSQHDHRIAMALVVAGLGATGETVIQNSACIQKSYPNFVASFQQIGACLE